MSVRDGDCRKAYRLTRQNHCGAEKQAGKNQSGPENTARQNARQGSGFPAMGSIILHDRTDILDNAPPVTAWR
jgi:hypothetical protein